MDLKYLCTAFNPACTLLFQAAVIWLLLASGTIRLRVLVDVDYVVERSHQASRDGLAELKLPDADTTTALPEFHAQPRPGDGLCVGACCPLRAPVEHLGVLKVFPGRNFSKPAIPVEDREVYFLHMRKAGGTTVRKWLKNLCRLRHQLDDCAWITEGCNMNEIHHARVFGPTTKVRIALVNLREPIMRFQSHVNYILVEREDLCNRTMDKSARWSARCNRTYSVDGEMERLRSCYSISRSADGVVPKGPPRIHGTWECQADVYVKTLVATSEFTDLWEKNFGKRADKLPWREDTPHDLEQAKSRLEAFHGVLITEFFDKLSFQEYISKRVMGFDKIIPLQHNNEKKYVLKSGSTVFDAEQRRRAESWNQQDIKLYDHAKQLLLHRMVDAGYCSE